MVVLEHRRHSVRNHHGHLTQSGVQLAREVSHSMPERFDYVVTSPLPRALQTAVAFGYGINEAREEIQEFNEFYRPLPPWDGGFQALFHYFAEHEKAQSYLRNFVLGVIESQPQAKSILFVSHSGIVESTILSCFLDSKMAGWGESLSYCEGVRWQWDGERFLNPELLRVSVC